MEIAIFILIGVVAIFVGTLSNQTSSQIPPSTNSKVQNNQWQEQLFQTMLVLENFQKETKSLSIKEDLKIIIEDLGVLIELSQLPEYKIEEVTRIYNHYMTAILDLLNLEKKYNVISNTANSAVVPINVDGAIKELKQTFNREIRYLYCQRIIRLLKQIIELKGDVSKQQELDLIQSQNNLALLKGEEVSKDAITITKVVTKSNKHSFFSFEAVVGAVICWFCFTLFWPEKYAHSFIMNILIGLIAYLVIFYMIKRFHLIPSLEEENKIEVHPIIEKVLNEEQTEMNLKAKTQVALLKDYNEKIPDERVSEELEAIIYLVEAIMSYLEKYPNQAGTMNKFLDYYLPTVMDLLEIYQLYDDMPNLSVEMKETLGKIEDSLDHMKQALNKKIEQFYQDESMIAGANMTMLNTLLHQDGLLEDSIKMINNKGE